MAKQGYSQAEAELAGAGHWPQPNMRESELLHCDMQSDEKAFCCKVGVNFLKVGYKSDDSLKWNAVKFKLQLNEMECFLIY